MGRLGHSENVTINGPAELVDWGFAPATGVVAEGGSGRDRRVQTGKEKCFCEELITTVVLRHSSRIILAEELLLEITRTFILVEMLIVDMLIHA